MMESTNDYMIAFGRLYGAMEAIKEERLESDEDKYQRAQEIQAQALNDLERIRDTCNNPELAQHISAVLQHIKMTRSKSN